MNPHCKAIWIQKKRERNKKVSYIYGAIVMFATALAVFVLAWHIYVKRVMLSALEKAREGGMASQQ